MCKMYQVSEIHPWGEGGENNRKRKILLTWNHIIAEMWLKIIRLAHVLTIKYSTKTSMKYLAQISRVKNLQMLGIKPGTFWPSCSSMRLNLQCSLRPPCGCDTVGPFQVASTLGARLCLRFWPLYQSHIMISHYSGHSFISCLSTGLNLKFIRVCFAI